jgi:hypothetical protein
MNLHPFLRLCTHPDVLSCCTSCALQPAAVVQHPSRKSFLFSRHPLHPSQNPMQGKIKGRGTIVRVKPCLHVGWDGTRLGRCCAVGVKMHWRQRLGHYVVVMAVNASLERKP